MIYTGKPAKASIYDNRQTRYTVEKIKSITGADIVFNGGLFDMRTYKPNCDVKVNGKVLNKDPWAFWGYGWNNGELPKVVNSNDMGTVENFISCLWAIHNGEKQPVNDNDGGMGGTRGRTAFGFKADGTMVIICTSDSNGAMKLSQARDKLYGAGCVNAIILDGGGSSQIISPDNTIKSSRIVSNLICVWLNKPQKGRDKLNIQQNLTTVNSNSRGSRKIEWIVVHYFGALANAKDTCQYFKDTYRAASAHYFVDENNIYQCVLDKDVSWHCGDSGAGTYKGKCTNANSIGIETRPHKLNTATMSATDPDWYFDPKTADNLVELIRYLMDKYNIDADHVIRHYDVTGKWCPKPFMGDDYNPYFQKSGNRIWSEFKARLAPVKPVTDPVKPTDGTFYRVQVGAFKTHKAAENFEKELQSKGYKTIIQEVKA